MTDEGRLGEVDDLKDALARETARVLTRMVPVIHHSESEASPFSCLPRCACDWVGERVHGWKADKFVSRAMSQHGRHTVEQFRAADPEFWAWFDAYQAAKEEQ